MQRQRYGGGGVSGYGNGYMDNQYRGRDQGWGGGGSWGDQYGGDRWNSGGRMDDMGWGASYNQGGMRNRKRGFDMGGYGPSPKMMRMDMGGPFRRFNRNRNQRRGPRRDGRKGGDADKSGDGSKGEDKKKQKTIPAWKKNPYHCHFCKVETKDKENHLKHLEESSHADKVKEREKYLLDMMSAAFEMNQSDVFNALMSGRKLQFCTSCYLQYTGQTKNHKTLRSHRSMEFALRVQCTDCEAFFPTRFQFEKHRVTPDHIRNTMYKQIEEENWDYDSLECPEEYDEDVEVGQHYVMDMKAFYCKVCDKITKTREINPIAHCKTEEHYNNFKAFCEVEKVERPKKIEERERKKQEEEEERKRLEAEKAEAEGKEKDEDKGEEEGGSDDGDNEDGGEAENEEGGEAENEEGGEAENEEGGEAENEEGGEAAEDEEMNEASAEEPAKEEAAEAEPQEEEKEETPTRGRTTRRRSAKK